MAIRNFVLKLVQKGSGKGTHVTIEQEAGSGVEPSPNVEYTFSKFFNGTYNEVISYKQIEGGEKIDVDWSVGAIEGNGADLIEIIRHKDGFEIKKKANNSPEEKQYLFYIIQAESGKKLGFTGSIEGKEYVFRKDRETGIIQPNEKNFKYVITSTCNGSFVNYKMTISGEGKEYIKCRFLDRIHQEVAENSDKKHYIYIQHLENSTGKDLPYVITLTQDRTGRKLEINGVVKKAISPDPNPEPDPDPDVKVMPEVWQEIVGVAPRYTLRLRWSNYDEMKSYSGDQLNVNLSISTPADPNTTGGKQIMETTDRHVVLERDNILEMPINSLYGKPEVRIAPFYKEGGNFPY